MEEDDHKVSRFLASDASGTVPERKTRKRKGNEYISFRSSDKDSAELLVLRSRIITRASNDIESCDKGCNYCACKPPADEEDNKASNASDSDNVERLKATVILKELDEELLRVPPFRAMCIKAAEVEAYNKHPDSDRNEEKVQKDVCMSVQEEIRQQGQARCASLLAINISTRISGFKKTRSKSLRNFQLYENYGEERTWLKLGEGLMDFIDDKTKHLPEKKNSRTEDDCHENDVIVKITGVTILPKVDGQREETVVGTLEAHSDRFIFKTSTSYFEWQLTFEYDNVKQAFFQTEDEELPDKEVLPLLHFLLHHPIKVGTKMTEHIQFRLVPDSEKFEKEKQTPSGGGGSKELDDFVAKVGRNQPDSLLPFSFRWVCKQGELHGMYKEKKFNGIWSFSSLLQLSDTPFVVVNLAEIEIVNLARVGHEEIDMTIVFEDFNHPVLQIKSIPSNSVDGIKRFLDSMNVKYYDNSLDLDWNSILKSIVDNPKKFIQEGGWDVYKLEDPAIALHYIHYRVELSQDDMVNKERKRIMDMCL